MKRYQEAKLFIAAFLASFCTSLGFWIKETLHKSEDATLSTPNIGWVAAIILVATFVSYAIPKWLLHLLLKGKWFRIFIWKNDLLEGYWHLKSYDNTINQNKLKRDGVAEITFNSAKETFEITVTRLNDQNGGKEKTFTTQSRNFVLVESESTEVVNQFTYWLEEKEVTGVSIGKFFPEEKNNLVDNYKGRIIIVHEKKDSPDTIEIVNQTGERIEEVIAKTYKKNSGKKDWKEKFINDKHK